jgi:hypothetical protein
MVEIFFTWSKGDRIQIIALQELPFEHRRMVRTMPVRNQCGSECGEFNLAKIDSLDRRWRSSCPNRFLGNTKHFAGTAFFDIPGSGSSSAAKALREAALATKDSKSFTVVTHQRGEDPNPVVYEAPDISSSKPLLDFSIVSVGQYTYIPDQCKKKSWEKIFTPTGYGPGGVMYDLDLLLSSQRVVRRGDKYLAEWVPSFPWVKVDVVATVKRNEVIAEQETFIYGKGTGWFLRPFSQRNYGYTVRYTRINSSPPIKVPRRGIVEEGSHKGAFRACVSFGPVSFGFPTSS